MAEEVADKGGGDKKKIIIKHVDEILKSTEKDEMKFGLLVGLIKTDQVSNKDVVNTVLHLLVGGEFEIETSFIIQESQNVFFMLEVLNACPPTLQAEIWSVFTAMLKKSRRNLNACTEVGLIEHALRMLENADDVVADLLVEMLGVLASYSITVKELRMLFALLKAKDGKWTRNSVKLLSVLRQMPQRHGPDEFFSFPGKKGSFISLPPVRTWPYQNGWAFSCWIRLDPVTGVTVEKEKPYLYCFRTSKGVGYSAHFLGSSLVITSMKIKGKGFQHCVKYEFSPRKWYMVTICHVYYRWSRSELRCYVDGELVSFTDMSWLVSTNDPFDKCFLGASSDGDPDTMFCGQMSAVYLFNEYLTANQVAAIYSLGPGYKSQFRFDNENSTILSENTRRVLYEGRLTSSIVFMYNPIACDSQLCLESSPKGNTSYFIHSPHALMLNDVKAVITRSLLSTLHSLGGVEVLFPLFGQLDLPVSKNPKEKPVIDLSICGNLMGLLCDLLESSSSIQEELLQNKGFLVISYLLEKSSREHITIEVLNSFLKLTQYLVRLPSGGTLLKHLFDHILFNPGLWIYASVEVQNRLYSYLATEFINDAQIYNNIRRVSAVLQTMHTLKYYYWVVNPKDRSGLTPKGVDGPRPTRDDIVRLRSYMLLYVVELIRKGQGILEDELQSILNYLTTLHEDDNLMDVLLLLVTLMAQHPSSMVPSFDKKNGIRTVFKLLASPSESLRIQALKLLGFFLMRSTHKRKYDAMNPQNLFSLIGERLMLNMQSITIGTYNVLFEILTERLTLEYCWEKHQEPESYYKLENPAILKVVATMIRQSKQTAELMEVKKIFLSDLTIMCNNNKENRRTLLQMSVWQEWLFSMAYIYPRSIDEQKITDMVMSLFRMLLHHAIKFEYGGWRVWVDTLAILHSKVAYEDFRIHMSKMYQQYERQRVDNVSDPQERRQHPISTISGVSDEALQNTVPKSSVQISEISENEITEETIEISQEDTTITVRQETIGCEGEVEKPEKEISLPSDGVVKEEIEIENTEQVEKSNKVEIVEIDHKEEKLEKDESERETKKDCDGLPEEQQQQQSDTANCDGEPENGVVELSDSKSVSMIEEEKSSDGGQFDVRDNDEEKENEKIDDDGTRNTEQHSELKADGEPDTSRKSSLKEDGKPEERKPDTDAENKEEQKVAEEQNDCKIEQVGEMTESGQNEQRENEVEDNKEKAETEATKEKTENETTEDKEKTENETTEDKEKTEKETTEDKEKTEKETNEDKEETETEDKEKTETEVTEDKEKTETEVTEDKEKTETEATEDKEKTETGATEDKEKTEIEATEDKEKTETEATEDKEKTETKATEEKIESETTKENNAKIEIEANEEKTEITKDNKNAETEKKDDEKIESEATKDDEKTETTNNDGNAESEAITDNKKIETETKENEKTEIEAITENDKTEKEGNEEKSETETTKEKSETEKEDVESTENDKTVCDDKDTHENQDDTVQIKDETESKSNQLENESQNKEVTEDNNKTLENTNDQDGDAPDLQIVAEDNSEKLDPVVENGQAEGSISYVSNEDQEAYMPGLEYETQPGPTGYYTQEGEMIFLNITEDGQMIYQTEDGRLVYQYPDENGHVIYHTGGAEMGYDAENPSASPDEGEYVDDDDVAAAEGSSNLDAPAANEHERNFSKYPGEVKHNENPSASECKAPDSGASARSGHQFEPADGNTGYKSRPTPNSNPSSRRGSHGTSGSRHLFSPGPRAPPFRIPEFRWSYLHQKLLSDLLFSIETDIQVWKSHSTRAVVDFVNSGENHIYVVNVTHMISQLADNLIMSCGGLLPLLAAATSPNGEIEILEPNQGLSIEQAVSILQRIMNMTDIVVFTSSTNFSELEQEKNMPPGGILRQCLRLVCTAAVRNCLECKHRYPAKTPVVETPPPPPPPPAQRQNSNSSNGADPIQSLIGGSHPSPKNIVENLGGQCTPIKDAEKLLQDMDITRLRAVVYRDVDETKQAQFLALAIVYFTSVLMVSKYRDILEPPSPASTPTLGPHRSAIHSPTSKEISGNETDEEVISLKDDPDTSADSLDKDAATVSVAADVHVATNGKDTDSSTGIKVSTDNTEEKSNDAETASAEKSPVEKPKTEAKDNDNTDNKTLEGTEAAKSSNEDKAPAAEPETTPNEGVTTTASSESVVNSAKDSGEESSTQVSKEEPVKDTNPASSDSTVSNAANTNPDATSNTNANAAPVETGSRDELIAADGTDNKEEAAPKTIPNEDSESAKKSENADDGKEVLADGESREENRQEGISSIRIEEKQNGTSADSSTKPPENLELTTKIPATFDNLPLPSEGSSLTERLEKALGSAAPLLREIFVDFAPFLSKTLIGSHGQELLVGGLVTLKQSSSVVELVMLLCSQEWQNSLQKHAGLAFIELVNEGRLLAHATRDHIVRVANEAEFILTRMRAEDVQKHAEFESLCAQTVVERKDEEKLCDHLITSAKRRDHAIASVHREKIVNILTNKHGAWGQVTHDLREFWKLDLWEDDFRRRRRFVKNPHGSTHPDATLKAAIEHGATEDAISQAREAFHAHLASVKKGQQQPPDYTDEELLMEERDFDQEFSGPVALSTSCKLISMGLAITGIMSITKTDLYFEMDEEDKDNKKISPQVLTYVDNLHGKWHFSEIRAVFSRRYLLQNVAIEIFTANRTAVMFAFPDHVTMKKVVNALPKVGIGIRYGLNQARRMSLASGKQLFKLSNMTQKWQRREISNFDYLVYLNTVAGRTFNDLNQYPIFPWVIVNYESKELDMSQPNNFRDLSKPIGALNPARKQFFDERYASWEHEQIPPFHYGTHYSTAAFTLNWLIRVEPFTTLFLNMQGGKFDHANRTFFSVGQAWKNCQRDTSDVKELIPEFYYLPEMFVNQNKFNFGFQDGDVKVDDVTLPPWAKTPDDFVRVNRMALESEFVSCQLHHWIDLIFGYKQRGPEAVRSTNVFYYLTYEGSVNLETMTDPVMKEAIENQIRSFGQTPSQLLTEPHPPRSSLMHLFTEKYREQRSILRKTPMMFSSVQDDLCMLMKFLSNSPITHVAANTHPMVPTPAVITITCNHNFAVNKWNPNYQQQGTPTSFSSDKNEKEAELPVLMDQLFTHNTGLHKRSLGDNFDQRLKVSHSSFVTTADNRFIFACGFWDKSFRIFATESARIVQVIYGHFDIVTCITKSESNTNHDCYIVTGSKDCTVMVWQFNSRTQAIVGDIGTAEKPTPKATLTGHQTEVVCVAVFSELGLVVSGSKNGPCLVHALTGDLLRSLDPPEGCFSPELITMSREAFVLVKFDQGNICSFTINGRLLRHVRHKDNILSMILSRGGEYLMTGGESGVADVWRTHDLTLLYSYPKCDGSIHSLSLSHDEKLLLLGLGTGCLLVFFIDFNKWHHEYQDRY